MDQARVFVFASADKDGTTHRQLEAAGCHVELGQASWATPLGDNEDQMAAAARGVDALVHSPTESN